MFTHTMCWVLQWKRLVTASALILAWFKLLEPTQSLVAEFYILVKMIILMLGKLLRSYAPLLAIVFLAWCFARWGLPTSRCCPLTETGTSTDRLL